MKWSGCSTEAGSQPLRHPGAGSDNCSGRAQSGAVFVSALISVLCPALFTDTALQPAHFLVVISQNLSWSFSAFKDKREAPQPETQLTPD